MPRYIKQHTSTSCGAIVMINACKWSGINITKKHHYYFICKKMKIKENNGILSENLGYFIHKFLEKKTKIKHSKIVLHNKIIKHIRSGGSAIISFEYKERKEKVRHVAFFSQIDENERWLGHNVSYGKTNEWITNRTMMKFLYYGDTQVWLLKRKKNV